MNTLLISYDLGSPETRDDYKVLIEKIKSYGTWAKPLYSVWLIKTSKACANVRDELKLLVGDSFWFNRQAVQS